jgi:hypothetical protein
MRRKLDEGTWYAVGTAMIPYQIEFPRETVTAQQQHPAGNVIERLQSEHRSDEFVNAATVREASASHKLDSKVLRCQPNKNLCTRLT